MGSIDQVSTTPQHEERYIATKLSDLMSLDKRVIVITGGARGIGLALAFAVSEAGASVAIIDASPHPDEKYKLLSSSVTKTKYYRSDVVEYDVLKRTFEEIVRDFGRIDGIITAAGVVSDQRFLERPPEAVKRCMNINSLGTYYAVQLAAKQMLEQTRLSASASRGAVVMIASISAHMASKGQFTSDYCMSKGAVLSLCKQLGVELAEHDIRVNCLSPGYIQTDMTDALTARSPHLGEIFATASPMRRIGDRTDLKAASVFLLSDASAYMTGAEMLITGGMHAGRI